MRYRLTAHEQPPTTDGRLALILGQACSLARRGLHPLLVDENGEGITVEIVGEDLSLTWLPAPTSLFDEAGEPPAWIDTAWQLLPTWGSTTERTT